MYGFVDAKTGRFPPNRRDNSLRAVVSGAPDPDHFPNGSAPLRAALALAKMIGVGSLGSDYQSPGGRTVGLLDGSGLATARN